MNADETRQFEMLVRVRDFGQARQHLFPDASLARQAFTSLGGLVTQIEAHHRRELTTSAAARAERKNEGRKALAGQLARICHTARVLGADTPGVAEQFTMPRRQSDHMIRSAARQVAEAAAPLADRFIQHGLPSTFLDDLARQADAFEAALRARGTSRDEQLAARERIKSLLAAAIAIVHKLDVLVANHLGGDEAQVAVWRLVRRIAWNRSRSKGRTPAAARQLAAPAAPAAPERSVGPAPPVA